MPSQNASFVHSSTRASSSSRHSGFRRQRSDDNFNPDAYSQQETTAGDRPVLEQDFSPTAPGGQALVGERPIESQPESAFTVVPSEPEARRQAEQEVEEVQGTPLRSSASAESLVKYNQDGELSQPTRPVRLDGRRRSAKRCEGPRLARRS
jgi:hypothetical protein